MAKKKDPSEWTPSYRRTVAWGIRRYGSYEEFRKQQGAIVLKDRYARRMHWQQWYRDYDEKHGTPLRANRRARYENNKEHELAVNRRWALDNPERMRAFTRIHESKRRALKRDSGGSHTWEEWTALVHLWGNKCLCCFKAGNEKTLERDHVIPIVSKGRDGIENIQPLCRRCNAKKNSRTIDYRFDRWAPMFGVEAK